MLYREFNELGYPFFPLHGVTKDGICECLNPKCEALFKHPRISNWQVTQVWEEEQIECMEMTGQLDTGYGILCKGLIVIDVDARNGGVESYSKLLQEVPEILECGFIVETGSGGGSKHLFFKAPHNTNLKSHLKGYEGLDFKSSGYVVGAGSRHKSGNMYKVVFGSPDDISEAPDTLIELLRVKEHTQSSHDYSENEISNEQIEEMLSFIDPDCDHETWIKIGMAIHHATNGGGFALWDKWSAKGSKYPNSDILNNRWASLGKSSNQATIGSLIHIAKESGYTHTIGNDEVTFQSDIDWGEIPDIIEAEETQNKKKYVFDPLNPPLLAGRITRWINGRSMYHRGNLAVAAALMLISSCGGMRCRGVDGITGNLFMFCVAGSGTGKESILQSFTQVMRKVGLTSAVHGAIKSEQEIARNIVQHQGAFYTLDEFGELLAKIQGARKKSGTASYLEGIVGSLMSIYSKANGIHLVGNDLRRSVLKELQTEANALDKAINENEDKTGVKAQRLESLKKQITDMETGIINPYLNILGFTAPSRFSGLLDEDLADNGFMARALIVREMDDNPRYNKDYKILKQEEDEEFKIISAILSNMYHAGHSYSGRVECMGEVTNIPVSKKSEILLEQIREHFWELGEAQKERHGFVAYTRRGYEMVNRIALVLSIGEHEISEEAIMWAFEFVKRDMIDKITLTNANTATDKGDALISKITAMLDSNHGVSIAVIKNKLKGYKSETIDEAVKFMLDKNMITSRDVKPLRGQSTVKYFKGNL